MTVEKSGPASGRGGAADAGAGVPHRGAAVQLNGELSSKSVPPPKKKLLQRTAPAIVGGMLGLMLLATGYETLRPSRAVLVSPVAYAPNSQVEESPLEPSSTQHSGANPDESQGIDLPQSWPTVQAAGWLEAEPYGVASTALADGVVQDILVLEGDQVQAGQVIARLVDADARLAHERAVGELSKAQADLQMAEAELTRASADWDHPVDRDRSVEVAVAELAMARAELEKFPSELAREQALLERYEEELHRAEQASASGASTQIEVVVLRKNTQAQRAAVSATSMQKAVLQANVQRLEALLRAAQRNAELRIAERYAVTRAQAGVNRARGEIVETQAIVDEAQLRLERMTITAPISGFVQRRLKRPGDKVMLGMDDPHSSHLVHLYDPEKLQVRVDVPLADASHVRIGQQCEVVVEVLPDQAFKGEVILITHEADLQKNTLQVKVRVINPSPALRPEMLTRVKFPGPDGINNRQKSASSTTSAETARSASAASAAHGHRSEEPRRGVADDNPLVVDALTLERYDSGKSRVWVMHNRRGETGEVIPVDVEVLVDTSPWARVQGQLHGGDLLVMRPDGLREGERVRIVTEVLVDGDAS